ncbi:MAG: signal peptidase I [Candidatus Woesearchaeota archaeon]
MSNNAFGFLIDLNKEQPFSFYSNEIKSPGDWIKENQVRIMDNEVTIVISNATWAKFTNTNSMDPVIDEKAHAIKLIPEKTSQLSEGDIISYRSTKVNAVVIHRIIDIGVDDEGVFFVTKGDNNKDTDPEKVRFHQITGVVVGILY